MGAVEDLAGQSGLEALHSLVRDCAASGVARRALLLRMDLLPPRLSRPHHLRLARTALDPLTLADRAQTHGLPGGRIVVSWRGDAPALLQQSLPALTHLLQDSPLDAPDVADLVWLYSLPGDGEALLAEAGSLVEQPTALDRLEPTAMPVLPQLKRLDATTLSALERQLATADVARFARRKAVVRLDADRAEPAWDKRYLSVTELNATLVPHHDMRADPWLFLRLTRVLDHRLLALLSDSRELRGAGPFSLNLNVASVLSPEFLRFDEALPPGLRGRIVLELSLADVVSDPAAFAFARDFGRARSYRLMLRDVTALLLPALSVEQLELDYIGLRWSEALMDLALDAPGGGTQWVLDQANDPAALRWGRAQGVRLFSGRAAQAA